MNEPSPVLPHPEFKDRHGGLIGFGILLLLGAVACALFVPLMFMGQALSQRTTGIPPDYRTVIPGAVVYGTLAITFAWLGIGSIKARRWARALVLILAWLWLVTGVITIGFMAAFVPRLLGNLPTGSGPQPPAAMLGVIMVVMFGIMSVIMVLLPGLLVLFYRSPHVKATCETRDPVPRWTDACPLPVLGVSVVLGFGAVSMLPMMFTYNSVVPFFGRLVNGVPGTLLLVALIAVWGYCAWAMYRLKPTGWWVIVIGYGLMMISALLTFSQVDLIEMYRLMGYPEAQIEQIRHFNLFTGRNLSFCMAVFAVPTFSYLLFVKRYFLPAAVAES